MVADTRKWATERGGRGKAGRTACEHFVSVSHLCPKCLVQCLRHKRRSINVGELTDGGI